jgi:hypothetical protein
LTLCKKWRGDTSEYSPFFYRTPVFFSLLNKNDTVSRVMLKNFANKFYVVFPRLLPPFIFLQGGRALKNCLVGNFSEGARLSRWPLLNLARPKISQRADILTVGPLPTWGTTLYTHLFYKLE